VRIAILGATSQIAKDLVCSFAAQSTHELVLFARRPEAVTQWMASVDLPENYPVHNLEAFSSDEHFNAILNFVGIGNPAQAAAMGAGIFDLTLQYDELALGYVRKHPTCRYIFLSSGAAYGSSFNVPAEANSKAVIPINKLQPQDWYGVAKLHAECRHRSLAPLPIVDIRVFNYFSHTQDMEARFLITDIVRAIRDKTVLKIAADFVVRDFIGPEDFYQLVNSILTSPATNAVVDCYSEAPIDKPALLAAMKTKFGLQYELTKNFTGINATGSKLYYYSDNKQAAYFGYIPKLTSLGCIEKALKLITQDVQLFINKK
jgi:nucleoside-diphosphate-sugar epimerase